MSLLRSTDVAAVSDKKAIHIFYQGDDGKIHEVISQDGTSWSDGTTLGEGQVNPNGSSLTAFYCENDETNHGKPSIHVLYLDNSNPAKLCEQVKAVTEESWTQLDFPSDIEQPTTTSKLASGVCHDDPSSAEAHHWVYFTNIDGGAEQIKELRRGGAKPWKNFKSLPQKHGTALPGTAFGCSLTIPTTFLQVQTHDLDIWQLEGGYDTWTGSELVVKAADTIRSTPLASVIDSDGKSHFFFAGRVDGSAWVQSDMGGKRAKIGILTPGSYIGAVLHNGKQYVFMNEAFHPTALSVYAYTGSSWEALGQIQAH